MSSLLRLQCFLIKGYIYMSWYSFDTKNIWPKCYIMIFLLMVIYVYHDLRKMFIILVWNVQQSFCLHHFHIIVLPVLFCGCKISIHCFIMELQYNHILLIPYDIQLYTIQVLHITSSHHNFEDIVNVN